METNEDFERRALELMADALDVASDARADWVRVKAGGDTALATRVLTLLDADTEGSVQIRTGGAKDAMADTPPPERVGAYRIVELIGRGGMGAVYLGERDTGDFEHRVAIKLIKPGILSEALVERFTRERQTLASLNHPHIARLFDGGALNDGTPYIVMEYIAGRGIVDHAKSRGLDARERFALFRTACEAVRHAHQNLVIHRDITPSNVLVTKAGEVKLIDFGIARPNEDGAPVDRGPGSLDSLTFTPGFAAPERSKGAGANTLSDIYSLGRLLEALLEPAMMDDDASAIIARATETDPLERYPSVDALIDDLDAYAGDRPLAARGGGAGYVFGKFLKRRKFIVAGLTAAFAAITLAFVNAQTQYQRAEARFEQARGLSSALTDRFYDQIAGVPGTLEARRDFAEILKSYNDRLAADPFAPVDVKLDVGRQYIRLSEIYGGFGTASLEEVEQSSALLTRAEEELQDLLAKAPDNSSAKANLIWAMELRAIKELFVEGDFSTAYATHEHARELAETFLAQHPGDSELLKRSWRLKVGQPRFLAYGNKPDEAIEIGTQYLSELREDADLTEPLRSEFEAVLALNIGEALVDTGRYEEALPPLRAALDIFERAEQENEGAKDDYGSLVRKLRTVNNIAAAERLTDDPKALGSARKSVAIAEAIRDADPVDVNGRVYVVTTREQLAKTLARAGASDEALAMAKSAVAERRAIVEDYPENSQHRRDLALTLYTEGIVSKTIGNTENGCAAFGAALDVYVALEAEDLLTPFEIETARPTIKGEHDGLGCPVR